MYRDFGFELVSMAQEACWSESASSFIETGAGWEILKINLRHLKEVWPSSAINTHTLHALGETDDHATQNRRRNARSDDAAIHLLPVLASNVTATHRFSSNPGQHRSGHRLASQGSSIPEEANRGRKHEPDGQGSGTVLADLREVHRRTDGDQQ